MPNGNNDNKAFDYYSESPYTPVEDPSGELARELEERRNWVKQWYSNPEFKERAKQAINRNSGNIDLARISKFMAYNLIPNTSEEYAQHIVKTGLEGLEDVDTQIVDFQDRVSGEYAPEENWLRVDKDYVDTSTGVHEYSHVGDVDELIPYLNQYEPVDASLYTKPDYVSYVSSPSEVYANLMELRYNKGIQPGETFNLEGVAALREGSDSVLFDLFSDEQILDMLNNWSANEGIDPNTLG